METVTGGVQQTNVQQSLAGEQSEWEIATESARNINVRSEITLEECAAPNRLAPFAFALAADIIDAQDDELATGKFILLHDPSAPDAWQGTFRAVTYIRARIEDDLATDSMLDAVIWSWLEEAMDDHGAAMTNLSGTITRTLSKSFGTLANREDENDVEIRASWTPDTADVSDHIRTWLDALARCAGLTPLPVGVTSLPRR